MRAIDADHLKRWIISRGLKSQLHPADIIDQIDREPTIEPRCEACEAFNKTRLLIPQPEHKKGKWIEQDDSWDGVYYECSACGEPWTTIDGTPWDNGMKFCPNCGARMEDER